MLELTELSGATVEDRSCAGCWSAGRVVGRPSTTSAGSAGRPTAGRRSSRSRSSASDAWASGRPCWWPTGSARRPASWPAWSSWAGCRWSARRSASGRDGRRWCRTWTRGCGSRRSRRRTAPLHEQLEREVFELVASSADDRVDRLWRADPVRQAAGLRGPDARRAGRRGTAHVARRDRRALRHRRGTRRAPAGIGAAHHDGGDEGSPGDRQQGGLAVGRRVERRRPGALRETRFPAGLRLGAAPRTGRLSGQLDPLPAPWSGPAEAAVAAATVLPLASGRISEHLRWLRASVPGERLFAPRVAVLVASQDGERVVVDEHGELPWADLEIETSLTATAKGLLTGLGVPDGEQLVLDALAALGGRAWWDDGEELGPLAPIWIVVRAGPVDDPRERGLASGPVSRVRLAREALARSSGTRAVAVPTSGAGPAGGDYIARVRGRIGKERDTLSVGGHGHPPIRKGGCCSCGTPGCSSGIAPAVGWMPTRRPRRPLPVNSARKRGSACGPDGCSAALRGTSGRSPTATGSRA